MCIVNSVYQSAALFRTREQTRQEAERDFREWAERYGISLTRMELFAIAGDWLTCAHAEHAERLRSSREARERPPAPEPG